jgi:hypothetical protein
MQGDILDILLSEVGGSSGVTDPFVGSGTTMTESLLRGIDFTGVDINPLAVLVCEAKVAIDEGVDLEAAIEVVVQNLLLDVNEAIDVDFPGLDKWFPEESAIYLSKVRRSVMAVNDTAARKVLWVVFADTIRVCSNSRTSTYKLHIRAEGEGVDVSKIAMIFRANLKEVLERARSYQRTIKERPRTPKARIICDDIRSARIARSRTRHDIFITSPPYGDNQTTIPYGQFSYLALKWIPESDLPRGWYPALVRNSHSLDSASLGGSIQCSHDTAEVLAASPTLAKFLRTAKKLGKEVQVKKVSAFMRDYFDAISKLKPVSQGGTHWVFTTGNRRAAGLGVPFDLINEDFVRHFGGRKLISIQRRLPNKRMPSRNSMGEMITTETTLIAEFV